MNKNKEIKVPEEQGKEVLFKKQIYRLFKRLGISPACKGYDFAMAAICTKHKMEQEKENFSVGKIYEEVAKTYGTNYRCVERNIRTLRLKMLREMNYATSAFVKEVFGTTDNISNAEFITSLYSYLRYEQEE